jgi:hypothetical protein
MPVVGGCKHSYKCSKTKKCSEEFVCSKWLNMNENTAYRKITNCTNVITRTNSTQLSPPWEVASCAATQEIPSSIWNTQVYYRVHKSPPLVPILNQNDPVHTTPSYLILSTQLRIGLPGGLFPSGFPTNVIKFKNSTNYLFKTGSKRENKSYRAQTPLGVTMEQKQN